MYNYETGKINPARMQWALYQLEKTLDELVNLLNFLV